jgi:hypothetical protein
MESTILGEINHHVLEMSKLSIHHTIPLTWIQKKYTYLEYPLAAAIASKPPILNPLPQR